MSGRGSRDERLPQLLLLLMCVMVVLWELSTANGCDCALCIRGVCNTTTLQKSIPNKAVSVPLHALICLSICLSVCLQEPAPSGRETWKERDRDRDKEPFHAILLLFG